MAASGAPREPADPAVRCLVLLAGEAQAADALVTALSRRGVPVHLVPDAPAAMATLSRQSCQVLIICDPDRVAWVRGLLSAVRRYYPRVHCWQYTVAGGRPRLRRAAGPNEQEGSRQWRNVGQQQDFQQRPEVGGGPDNPGEPLLSSEEIAMLLGTNDDRSC